ncbi:MAG: EamA family transporter [Clostridia bacterium]|nr:EamA family transporter [Clostridia bacterium]
MPYLLLAFLIILYTLQSLFTKLYTDKYPGKPDNASATLTTVSGLTVAVITFFCFSLCRFTFNGWTVLIGALNAVALFGYNYFIVKASQSGPYSILMMFSLAGGIILPIVAALILGWDSWTSTPVILINVISIVAIIAAVYLVSGKSDASGDEKQRVSLPFILSCLGLGVCNGVYGIFLTLQQRTEEAGGEANRDEMVILTFLFAALISTVTSLIKNRKGFFATFRQTRISFLYLALTSIVFALAINLIVILIPQISTTVLYTLDNSSVLIMSVIASAVFFRERLSVKNIVGIVIMVCALVSMNLLPTLVA